MYFRPFMVHSDTSGNSCGSIWRLESWIRISPYPNKIVCNNPPAPVIKKTHLGPSGELAGFSLKI